MANQPIFPSLVPNRPVAGPNLTTPGDVQTLQDQYDLQRNQAIAQLLTQQGLEGTPQGQIVGGHYIRPNGFQGMANALKLYMGTKAMDDLPRQQAQIQANQDQRLAAQFGVGQPQPAPTDTGVQSFPVGDSGAPPQGQPMGGAAANPQAMGAALRNSQPQMQTQAPSMPILPGKTAMESWQIARSIGIPEYMKLAAQQNNLTDAQKNLQAAGYRPGTPEYQQALLAMTSRPLNVAPGGTILDPVTRQPIYTAPQNGIQIGPNGATEVPNYGNVNAKIQGQTQDAQEQARARYDTQPTLNTATGNTENRTRLQNVAGAEAGTPTLKEVNPQVVRAGQNQTLIDSARQLLPNASSGTVSSAFNQGVGSVGISTKAAQADAQLKIIAAQLVQGVPRFEGPQSDKDVQSYKEAAGNVADASIPIQTRLAALKTMEDLQNKYLQSKGAAVPKSSSAPASGDYSHLWGN